MLKEVVDMSDSCIPLRSFINTIFEGELLWKIKKENCRNKKI